MKEELLKLIKQKIQQWTSKNIYAISLYVSDYCDNPYEPTVTLGYNTEEQFQKEIENASDELEARWNYAFWLQNEELIFGIGESKELVKNWILESGHEYYSYEELFLNQNIITFDDEKITKAFVNLLIDIVKELHESGFIRKKFGREIPILVHELEYYNEIAEQNVRANGLELVKDFVTFCIT